jgi:hypothetical protein
VFKEISSSFTTTVFDNNLPQNLLARKHGRQIVVRQSKPPANDRLSAVGHRVFFIFLIVLLLKSSTLLKWQSHWWRTTNIEVAWHMIDVERNFTSPMSTELLKPR